MPNPKCKTCTHPTQKWGTTTTGKPRYRCPQCKTTQTRHNTTTARDLTAFWDYLLGEYTYRHHPGQGRSLRRRFAPLWKLWPVHTTVKEHHHVIFVDGIYLAHRLAVLIACTKTHVLGWYVARNETTAAWMALFSRIAAPDVVVCDGGSGIASALKHAWPTTRIQRCTYHAFCTVKRYTTTRARTQAGVELYGLAKDLLGVATREEAVDWVRRLATWNQTWKALLAEKTRLSDGRIVDTHARLIKARNSLNTLVGNQTLFTYLEPALVVEDDPIPATSNLIEGKINSQLRAMLRRHRGMSLLHQVKAVLWWCQRHTENPGSAGQVLRETVSDEQIATLFARARERHQAQAEAEMWGTGIEWTDLHNRTKWNPTY